MGSSSGRLVIAWCTARPHGHGLVLVSMALVLVPPLLSISVTFVNAQSVASIVSRSFFDDLLNAPSPPNAQNCGCTIEQCCNRYGDCGTTSPYCGYGCQSGNCYSSIVVGTIISSSFFQGLAGAATSFCEGKGFYSYNAFITAASGYPGFGTTGSIDDRKRELAAFFAHVMHVTGGLCYINEINPSSIYCQMSSTWPCTSGKSYHGRGPIQLCWNYNYGAAGESIGFDGLNNPEKVGQDPTISFKTSVWFWMADPLADGTQTCHTAITSGAGFGATIGLINAEDCNTNRMISKVNYYKKFCSQLDVDPGTNISC